MQSEENTEIKTETNTEETGKRYVKPEVKKHKSMAVVSGSGCTYYLDSGDYYH
jgi:hypothetical protein